MCKWHHDSEEERKGAYLSFSEAGKHFPDPMLFVASAEALVAHNKSPQHALMMIEEALKLDPTYFPAIKLRDQILA